MPIIRIKNAQNISPEEFQEILREAWENCSPLDDLLEWAVELRDYERKYGMTSEDFCERFERGELGDDMDFFHWIGIYHLFVETKKDIEQLLAKAETEKEVAVVG